MSEPIVLSIPLLGILFINCSSLSTFIDAGNGRHQCSQGNQEDRRECEDRCVQRYGPAGDGYRGHPGRSARLHREAVPGRPRS